MWRDVNTLRAELLLVYFRLGSYSGYLLYVQQMWGIIGHVTVEAGSPVGTDGAPPHYPLSKSFFSLFFCKERHAWAIANCTRDEVVQTNTKAQLAWVSLNTLCTSYTYSLAFKKHGPPVSFKTMVGSRVDI